MSILKWIIRQQNKNCKRGVPINIQNYFKSYKAGTKKVPIQTKDWMFRRGQRKFTAQSPYEQQISTRIKNINKNIAFYEITMLQSDNNDAFKSRNASQRVPQDIFIKERETKKDIMNDFFNQTTLLETCSTNNTFYATCASICSFMLRSSSARRHGGEPVTYGIARCPQPYHCMQSLTRGPRLQRTITVHSYLY